MSHISFKVLRLKPEPLYRYKGNLPDSELPIGFAT